MPSDTDRTKAVFALVSLVLNIAYHWEENFTCGTSYKFKPSTTRRLGTLYPLVFLHSELRYDSGHIAVNLVGESF